jgi:hypothetical protein
MARDSRLSSESLLHDWKNDFWPLDKDEFENPKDERTLFRFRCLFMFSRALQ